MRRVPLQRARRLHDRFGAAAFPDEQRAQVDPQLDVVRRGVDRPLQDLDQRV